MGGGGDRSHWVRRWVDEAALGLRGRIWTTLMKYRYHPLLLGVADSLGTSSPRNGLGERAHCQCQRKSALQAEDRISVCNEWVFRGH